MTRKGDDMVIRPVLEGAEAATPPGGSEKRPGFKRKVRRGGRVIRRAAAANVARKVATRRAARRAAAARGGGSLLGGAATAVLAAVAVIATARLATGRSFEGMGTDIEKWALGPTGLGAIARQQARRKLMNNPFIARHVSDFGLTPQVLRLGEVYRHEAFIEARGTARFMQHKAFDVNSTADLLLLSAARNVKAAGAKVKTLSESYWEQFKAWWNEEDNGSR